MVMEFMEQEGCPNVMECCDPQSSIVNNFAPNFTKFMYF